MATLAPDSMMDKLEDDLFNFDLRNVVNNMDLKGWSDKVDLQAAGLAALVAAAVVFLLKVFLKSVSPFGRSLSDFGGRTWDEGGNGIFASASQSFETLTTVLGFLTEAATKWGEQTPSHRSL